MSLSSHKLYYFIIILLNIKTTDFRIHQLTSSDSCEPPQLSSLHTLISCDFVLSGVQDRPDHRHEGAWLVPAEHRGLLHPRRPLETGVGEGCPGPRQPPVHPAACCQVGRQEHCKQSWFSVFQYMSCIKIWSVRQNRKGSSLNLTGGRL